jgi:putative transposase
LRWVGETGYDEGDDFTARWNEPATCRFLESVIDRHGKPKTITIDKSGANTAATNCYNAARNADIGLRQCKYLNNIVEQDHRAIKRLVRPMLGFKSMCCARIVLAGIETMHLIHKVQLRSPRRLGSVIN